MHSLIGKVNFLVVGTQKGGTTALDKYLRTHCDLQMANNKEVHFFDNESFFKEKINYEMYHAFFETNLGNKLFGECTPIYMYWHDSMKRIYNYNSNIKIIAVLRNPIYRAYSHWNMERDRNADTLSFSEAIRTENKRCRESLPLQHRIFSYIDRGFYTEQLRRIWRYFPNNQTLILKHEELKYDISGSLSKVSQFLEISPFRKIKYEQVHSREYVSKLKKEDFYFLKELYTFEIKQLEMMLGWDCSEWLNAEHKISGR